MKRSEMLFYMENEWLKMDGLEAKFGHKFILADRMDIILTWMEFNGMSPPERKIDFTDKSGQKHDYIFDTSWEPEDE